jgi:hypothetical protein
MRDNMRRAAAATVICLLAALSTASGAAASGSASAAATPKVERQLAKLRKQVKKLKRAVARISSAQPAPQGSAGSPSGPAAGDLTGSYPSPQIGKAAVGGLELAGNAITHDTTVIDSDLGNFTSKVGAGAIGRDEIADGQVQAAELGQITRRMISVPLGAGKSTALLAQCEAGEVRLSGGVSWGAFVPGLSVLHSAPTSGNGWYVAGTNGSTSTVALVAHVLCLG